MGDGGTAAGEGGPVKGEVGAARSDGSGIVGTLVEASARLAPATASLCGCSSRAIRLASLARQASLFFK